MEGGEGGGVFRGCGGSDDLWLVHVYPCANAHSINSRDWKRPTPFPAATGRWHWTQGNQPPPKRGNRWSGASTKPSVPQIQAGPSFSIAWALTQCRWSAHCRNLAKDPEPLHQARNTRIMIPNVNLRDSACTNLWRENAWQSGTEIPKL